MDSHASHLGALLLIAGQAFWPTLGEAQPFNVNGRITFHDGDPVMAAPPVNPLPSITSPRVVPARFVKVSILQGDEVKGRGHTDSRGNFSIPIHVYSDRDLSVELEVDNAFAYVLADTDCVNEPLLHRESIPTRVSPTSDIELNRRIEVEYVTLRVGHCGGSIFRAQVAFAGALNINNVVQAAFADVAANRDPREDDSVAPVWVEYCDNSSRGNHYLWELYLVCHNVDGPRFPPGFNDRLIVHEYGHHLQHEIGTWDWHAGAHNDCDEVDTDLYDDPEFAFAEGFPDYLAQRIVRTVPDMSLTGIADPETLCSGGVTFASGARERFVAVEGVITGALWDLADGLGTGADAFDLVDGPAVGGHRRILEIFDRELDATGPLNLFANAPDVRDFYMAWAGRTGSTGLTAGKPVLNAVFNRIGQPGGLVAGFAVSEGSSFRKDPPLGFVEPLPVAGAGMSSSYEAATNTLTIEQEGGFLSSFSPPSATVNAGITNLPGATMLVVVDIGSVNPQTSAATIDATGTSFFDLAGARFMGPTWLQVTRTDVAGGAPPTGAVTPGQLVPLRLQLLPAAFNLPEGLHSARVPVRFAMTTDRGAMTETRTIHYRWRVRGGDWARSGDPDRDGLTNEAEITGGLGACLDPRDRDSDDDGLTDGDEVGVHGTDPCKADTDDDGATDREETRESCFDPIVPDDGSLPGSDPDGDGLTNAQERRRGTSPCSPDTDGDGVSDAVDVCPLRANPGQEDYDGDGLGDECDTDRDGDGVLDLLDRDPLDPNVGADLPPMDAFTIIDIPGSLHLRPEPLPFPCDPRTCDPAPHIALEAERGVIRALAPDFQMLEERAAPSYGLQPDDGLGASLAWLPDLDLDGTADLAVGAPGAPAGEQRARVGLVLLLSGRSLEEIGRISGTVPGSRFGSAVTWLGDGRLAVAAPGDDQLPGAVHLVEPGVSGSRRVITAGEIGDRFGAALTVIPTGKDCPCLAVGAPAADGAGFDAGALYLAEPALDALPRRIAEGAGPGDRFGATLVAPTSGDEVRGLLVGAPQATGTQVGPNRGTIPLERAGRITFLTLSGDPLWSVTGRAAGERIGTAAVALPGVAPAGGAYLVSAPGAIAGGQGNAGALYLVSEKGEIRPFLSGLEASLEARIDVTADGPGIIGFFGDKGESRVFLRRP